MPRTNRVSQLPHEAQKRVIDMYLAKKSSYAILAMLRNDFGITVSQKSVLNFIKKFEAGDIQEGSMAKRNAEELLAEAVRVYQDLFKKYSRAQSHRERIIYLQEMRNWWDRLSKISGLLTPEGSVNVNVYQQVNTPIIKLMEFLCEHCRLKLSEIEPPEDKDEQPPARIQPPPGLN